MNGTRFLTLTAALVMSAAGFGCRKDAETKTTTAPPPAPAASATPAIADVKQQIVNAVRIGQTMSPDGGLAAETTTFTKGDPVIVAMDVSTISPGSTVALTWYSPDGSKRGQEELTVPKDAKQVTFAGKHTDTWPVGEHRVEVAVGGAVAGTRTFTVQAKTADSAAAGVAPGGAPARPP